MSGLMTNAPYMLNVDCDMYVNEADVVRQAMCIFLQKSMDSNHCAFVQYPQDFYDSNVGELTVLQLVRFISLLFLWFISNVNIINFSQLDDLYLLYQSVLNLSSFYLLKN